MLRIFPVCTVGTSHKPWPTVPNLLYIHALSQHPDCGPLGELQFTQCGDRKDSLKIVLVFLGKHIHCLKMLLLSDLFTFKFLTYKSLMWWWNGYALMGHSGINWKSCYPCSLTLSAGKFVTQQTCYHHQKTLQLELNTDGLSSFTKRDKLVKFILSVTTHCNTTVRDYKS